MVHVLCKFIQAANRGYIVKLIKPPQLSVLLQLHKCPNPGVPNMWPAGQRLHVALKQVARQEANTKLIEHFYFYLIKKLQTQKYLLQIVLYELVSFVFAL